MAQIASRQDIEDLRMCMAAELHEVRQEIAQLRREVAELKASEDLPGEINDTAKKSEVLSIMTRIHEALPIMNTYARQGIMRSLDHELQRDQGIQITYVVQQMTEALEILADGAEPEKVPEPRQSARAYEKVREARKWINHNNTKPIKDAAILIREMLALQCCAIVTSGTVVDWDGAFGRSVPMPARQRA